MSGKRYSLVMAPAAHRRFRRFPPPLQEKIKIEAKKLTVNPYRGEALKGPLKGIHSYRFSFQRTDYRIAYRVSEERLQIEIVLVHPRQNFYELLRQVMRR
jgi:mRNA-degrading endonuclease RelE of RelBE toxin-antitoxin system